MKRPFMKSHKDLDVWKDAILMTKKVYAITENVPRREEFGLAAQIRKSAFSISSNIAEGAARRGNKEFLQFLYVALGSASELDTQLEIARLVNLVPDEAATEVIKDLSAISRMLQGLIRSLKAESRK
jgi:four helix bundle protein